MKPDGIIERLKARLVAIGDKQLKGKEYKHNFCPIVKFTSVRILIALSVIKDWKSHQLDINDAFLHGYIEEEIYMRPPQAHRQGKMGKFANYVQRSLYGLKQTSRQWNIQLERLSPKKCKQSKRDYSLFCRKESGKLCIILVYVDDLLITGDDIAYIEEIKKALDITFTVEDLGEMRYFLGLEVARNSEGIMLHQRKYAWTLLLIQGC